MEMSFSTLISDAISATFSSIKVTTDAKRADLLIGATAAASSSRSAFGWVRAVFTSLPQLMQVILSPKRTWTPPHLWHGSLVSVPPLAKREAPALILLTLSSEEAIVEYFCCRQIFSLCL